MKGKIELVEHSADLVGGFSKDVACSSIITAAARVCTAQDVNIEDVDAHKTFVRKLMQWGHWSPFEFVDLTFRLTTTRAVANELVRHRVASYMQESQRYCRYDDGLKVIVPKIIFMERGLLTWWVQVHEAYQAYLKLLEQGLKPEDARTVLPLATATSMLCKMNLREFRHFLDLRTAPAAWSEMRILAGLMAQVFAKQFPDEVFLIEDVWHNRGN